MYSPSVPSSCSSTRDEVGALVVEGTGVGPEALRNEMFATHAVPGRVAMTGVARPGSRVDGRTRWSRDSEKRTVGNIVRTDDTRAAPRMAGRSVWRGDRAWDRQNRAWKTNARRKREPMSRIEHIGEHDEGPGDCQSASAAGRYKKRGRTRALDRGRRAPGSLSSRFCQRMTSEHDVVVRAI